MGGRLIRVGHIEAGCANGERVARQRLAAQLHMPAALYLQMAGSGQGAAVGLLAFGLQLDVAIAHHHTGLRERAPYLHGDITPLGL